jgi:hypothetical protein
MRTAIALLLVACSSSPPTSTSSSANTRTSADAAAPLAAPAATSPPATSTSVASAKAICEALTSKGFGTNCTEDKPGGLGAAAWERYAFDLPDPKGKTCQILTFKTDADFQATLKAFDGAAALAGPHRYGNAKARVFVQCNSDMPRDAGSKLEQAVAEL